MGAARDAALDEMIAADQAGDTARHEAASVALGRALRQALDEQPDRRRLTDCHGASPVPCPICGHASHVGRLSCERQVGANPRSICICRGPVPRKPWGAP